METKSTSKKKILLLCLLAGVIVIIAACVLYMMRFRFVKVEGEYTHFQFGSTVTFVSYPNDRNSGTYESKSDKVEIDNTTGEWKYSDGKLLIIDDTISEMYQLMSEITGEDYGYDGTVFIYDKGYFICLDDHYSGEIPNGNTFDAVVTDDDDKCTFYSDGTVKKENESGTYTGTYVREGDVITITLDNDLNISQSYLIYNGGLYFNVYMKK